MKALSVLSVLMLFILALYCAHLDHLTEASIFLAAEIIVLGLSE